MPQVMRVIETAKRDIGAIFPTYFQKLLAAESTRNILQDQDQFPFVTLFLNYLDTENRNAARNNLRQQLPLKDRLALHRTEAYFSHSLKAHVELIEAYRWHQISSRRQEKVLLQLRDGSLGADSLMVQFDFKENVRYPISILPITSNKQCFFFLYPAPLEVQCLFSWFLFTVRAGTSPRP